VAHGAVLTAGAPEAVLERARRIGLVLLDVDGVLTDGRFLLLADGNDARAFHTRDGHGIRMGQRAGLEFGILSGRRSRAVDLRAQELGLAEVLQGVGDKGVAYRELLARRGLDDARVCYVGDDVVDLPVLRRAGLAIAPADAAPEARAAAHWVTRLPGGHGAVRETVELLLRAQGLWEREMDRYLRG
jgi:3-deoxy-D-manno-octulosonate 8-phosphate phosphatase (KDO 8-P phosphatase)